MAVPERTYADPTASIINSIVGLGGTKGTGTTSTSVDPAALEQLRAILGQQMAGTTPEGSAALLQAIFQGGLEQVPGLATTYAQAAGARSSNNSPFATAMKDMMLKLTQEGAKQVSANQVNAANTAATVANATKTTNTTETKAPKASALQLAPFILGAAGKLKNLPSFDEAVSSFQGLFGANSGINAAQMSAAAPMLDTIAGQSADAFGFDYGADAAPVLSAAADTFGFGSSDAMGFDFGTDVGTSAAGDLGSFAFDTMGTDLLEGGFLGFDKGGLVGRDGDKPQRMKPLRLASGGYITADRGSNLRDRSGQQIRGSTFNESGNGGLLPILLAATGGTGNIGGSARKPAAIPAIPAAGKKNALDQSIETGGESSVGSGIATGQVGTPAENNAAAIGFAGQVAAAALGVPGIAVSLGLQALGIPNTPISPISPLVNTIINAITGATGAGQGMTEGQAHGAAMGDADANFGGLAGMGVTMGLSPEDAAASIGGGFAAPDAGVTGEGAIGGEASSDSVGGDASGSGDSVGGGDGGVGGEGGGEGGDSFAEGGKVKGPKGKDVIPAYLTAGEYVVPKEAVAALGVPFFDAINAMFGGARG